MENTNQADLISSAPIVMLATTSSKKGLKPGLRSNSH
jgi:hypothetical protein